LNTEIHTCFCIIFFIDLYCTDPIDLGNGQTIYSTSQVDGLGYTYGTLASFVCDEGYILNGTNNSECTQQCIWSDIPTCDSI
jgi:hypothetical protein